MSSIYIFLQFIVGIAQGIIPCHAKAFLDYDYCGVIYVRQNPDKNSEITYSFQNDTEYIYSLDILGKTEDAFFVAIYDANLEYVCKGFLEKTHICIYTMPYHIKDRVVLYNDNSKQSDICYDAINDYEKIYVVDAAGDWLKVDIRTRDNKSHIGWLPPDNQCGEVYTSCCGT